MVMLTKLKGTEYVHAKITLWLQISHVSQFIMNVSQFMTTQKILGKEEGVCTQTTTRKILRKQRGGWEGEEEGRKRRCIWTTTRKILGREGEGGDSASQSNVASKRNGAALQANIADFPREVVLQHILR